jgi:methionyl-tRNA formyltransferase
MNNDKKIGVTIMKIEEKLDSGPILISKEIELVPNKTHGNLEKKLSMMGADLLIESLKNLKKGSLKFINQNHSESSYAKKIDKRETKINWNLDANRVLAHIHGLSPNPGAWFEYKNERYKVLKVKKSSNAGEAGCVLDEDLTVGCKLNSIKILEIQRQGKNKQTTKEFLLGKKFNKDSTLN